MYVHKGIHTHTYIHTYIHTYMDVSVAEWLAWLTSNCGLIGAIGSSPSNGLKPNMLGQKGFNPLCQCVYIYVFIVNPDIQTIHRCSHTSIHTYMGGGGCALCGRSTDRSQLFLPIQVFVFAASVLTKALVCTVMCAAWCK